MSYDGHYDCYLEADFEILYWKFISLVSGDNEGRRKVGLGPMNDRDAFKQVLREWKALELFQQLAEVVLEQSHSSIGQNAGLSRR